MFASLVGMKKIIFTSLLLFNSLAYCDESLKIYFNSPIDREGPKTDCSDEICSSLLELIENAKSTIDFAIYGLRGQPHILNALIAAENKGIIVRGIIDKTVDGKSYYSDTHLLEKRLRNIKSDHKSDLRTKRYLEKRNIKDNKECERPNFTDGPLQCFEGKGYASKEEIFFTGDIMHNKFFIIDKRFIWTGSANISDTGVGGYNANIVGVLDSIYFARFYTQEFEQMYTLGDHHRQKNQLKKQEIKKYMNPSTISLFFSPQGYAMYEGVIPLINQAEESVDLSIFFLTHKNASKALVRAKKRGVKVRVIVDATGATNGYSKHKYLRDNGIDVKVESWGGKMHMKAALIDKKHIIIGSMNWTSAGESKNDENTLVVLNDSINGKDMSNFFERLWDSIPDKFLNQDPAPESLDSGASCYDGIDNDFDKKIDGDDFIGCTINF